MPSLHNIYNSHTISTAAVGGRCNTTKLLLLFAQLHSDIYIAYTLPFTYSRSTPKCVVDMNWSLSSIVLLLWSVRCRSKVICRLCRKMMLTGKYFIEVGCIGKWVQTGVSGVPCSSKRFGGHMQWRSDRVKSGQASAKESPLFFLLWPSVVSVPYYFAVDCAGHDPFALVTPPMVTCL